jgi:thiol-disulfide isomerase/thioredoxin
VVLLVASCAPGSKERGPAEDAGGGAVAADPGLRAADAAALQAAVRESGSRVVVLNVWATWCVPCREEFPDLLRLREAYRERGLSLILVSADFDDQLDEARRFLDQHGVDFTTYVKTGNDMEFIDSLNPRWTGALPATFVYDSAATLSAFWEGKASYDEMEQRVLAVLGPSE